MTDEEMKKWFEYYSPQPLATIGISCCPLEDMYQAIKTRLMQECSVVPRMTPEEFEEWKKKMVAE